MKISSALFAASVWLPKLRFSLGDPTCSNPGTRTLDGTCYNSNDPNLGANGSFIVFEFGQDYPEGDGLLFLRAVDPKPVGDTYAADISSVIPEPGACRPENCVFSGTVEEFAGLGSVLQGMSPRELSNKLHSTPTTDLNDFKEETQAGISSVLSFFGQFVAHDIFGTSLSTAHSWNLPFEWPNLSLSISRFPSLGRSERCFGVAVTHPIRRLSQSERHRQSVRKSRGIVEAG